MGDNGGSITISEITIFGSVPREFPSADAAAITALLNVLPTSLSALIEYSGPVFQKRSGKFYFLDADTLNSPNSSEADFSYLDFGDAKWMGVYHTHPVYGRNWENFSVEDMLTCKFRNKTIW